MSGAMSDEEGLILVDKFYENFKENFAVDDSSSMELEKFRPRTPPIPIAEDKIILNIGGVRFQTLKSTLRNVHESTKLSLLDETSKHYDPVNREYFFDRNPSIFEFILEYHRNGGILHIPTNYCGPLVKGELDFWNISDHNVATCCQADYREYEENMKSERALMEEFQVTIDPALLKRAEVSYKYQLYLYLEYPHSSAFAQVWAFTFALLTILSIMFIFMATMPVFRTDLNATSDALTSLENGSLTHARKILLGGSKPNLIFQTIELVFMAIFLVEFLFRLIMSPRLILFVKSFTNFIDLTCLSTYSVAIVIYLSQTDTINHTGISVTLMIVRLVQVLRVFRIFKLAKQYIGFKVLILSLKKSTGQLALLVLIMFVFTLIFATLMFLAELSETQSSIQNIPTGIWWAIITLTTIGYGDVWPSGIPGKILGSLCAFAGMVFAALCVPIVTGNFLSYHKQAQALDKIQMKHQVTKPQSITRYKKTFEPSSQSPHQRTTSPTANANTTSSTPNTRPTSPTSVTGPAPSTRPTSPNSTIGKQSTLECRPVRQNIREDLLRGQVDTNHGNSGNSSINGRMNNGLAYQNGTIPNAV